jgi:type I restriction enzyme S subunit
MNKWASAKLEDVCLHITDGSHFSPATTSTGVPYVTVRDISNGKIDLHSSARVSQASFDELERNGCRPIQHDVLFSKDGTVGKVALVQTNEPFVVLSSLAILRPMTDLMIPAFLALCLQSPEFQLAATGQKTGLAIKRVVLKHLKKMSIPLPPLPVQRRIVDLMAHLDNQIANLRTERDAAGVLLSVLRSELMNLSDLVPLSTLAAPGGIQIGPFGSQLHAHEYAIEGTPVVMPRDLVDGGVGATKVKRVNADVATRLSRHRLNTGDIVFPRRGDLSKRALITDEEDGWLCGTGCIRFRPREGVDGGQVFQSISGPAVTDWLIEHAVGTTMLNLNSQIVSALPVATPNDASAPISAASQGLSACADSLGQELGYLENLRSALLSTLLCREVEVDSDYVAVHEGVA